MDGKQGVRVVKGDSAEARALAAERRLEESERRYDHLAKQVGRILSMTESLLNEINASRPSRQQSEVSLG